MFVVINKDWSIAQLTPSKVYQGSNEASFLGIFAPFSVSSYPAVVINIEKPSGEYIAPLVAFMTPEQPTGFGAWSVALPASVTALPGTVKASLTFYGSGYTVSEDGATVTGSGVAATTEPIEITVVAAVPGILPETPSANIYQQILENLAAILQRHPDWTQSDDTQPDYIKNKPAIKAASGAGSVVLGGADNENSATGTNSAAGGTNSSAAGDNSIVYGEELRSTAPTAFGRYNKDSANDIFQIGCGTAENARENAVSVSREGTTTFKRTALPNAPTAPTDGANKQYVDERYASLSQALNAGLAQKLNQKNIDPTEFSEDYYRYPNGKGAYGVDNY
ncbi:MAG: hypothetical protein IJY04_06190, partial [Clostridia bacterium]|nr:hypothetical protein [Clostridia bacterium]